MSVFPGTYYGGWGFPYGGGGLYAQPVDRPADPDAKAKPADPVRREDYAWASGPAGFTGWEGKAPPWDLSVAAAMWRYSAVQLVLRDIACPIVAAARSFEVRNEDGTEASKSKQRGPRTGDAVTATPEDKLKDALEKYFEPRWLDVLSSVKQCVHYGWALSEVVYGRVETPVGTMTLPVRFPDFQPWDVTLLRDPYGQFAGYRPRWSYQGKQEDRGPEYALHFTEGAEANPLFGWGRSINALSDWWDAINSRDNRGRAEQKAAGISLIIRVATGQSFLDANNQPVVPNTVAQNIFNGLSSGGAVLVPKTFWTREDIKNRPELADMAPVDADQFDWGSTAPAILAAIAARNASDVAIVRAYGRKERGLMEGEHGTKAEAWVHKSSDQLDGEEIHARLMRQFSTQTLNTILATNRGEAMRDRIYVKAGPLSDESKGHRWEIAKARVAQPGTPLNMMYDDREEAKALGIPWDDSRPEPAMLEPPDPGDDDADDGEGEPGANGRGNGRMANVG